MTSLAVVTIVSNNYLHFARTLMQSVAKQHPMATRYCVVVDRNTSLATALETDFRVIELEELSLPHGDEFLFQYNLLELNTATKPWALRHLLERGHDQVFYLDPDICLYRPMDEAAAALEAGASIVLTPHLLAPCDDGKQPAELDIRRAGTYNLGFCAIRRSEESLRFLKWWQGKLERHCVNAPDRGIFVDQSWIDLVPGLFKGVCVLRHAGYNVAYWNIAQRPLEASGGQDGMETITADGEPLVFFHYSGLDPLAPEQVSRHQNRHTIGTVCPAVRRLIEDYCARVLRNGLMEYRGLPYGFGRFRNGCAILDGHRMQFIQNSRLRQRAGGRPFERPELFIQEPGSLLDQTVHRPVPLKGLMRLRRLYAHFLGRWPEDQAIVKFGHRCLTVPGCLWTAYKLGTSGEAKSHPGWGLRLLSFPMLRAQLPPPSTEPPAPGLVDPARRWLPLRHGDVGGLPGGKERPVRVGLNIVGYVNAELGVGEASRALMQACAVAGVPFSVVDVGYQAAHHQQRDARIPPNVSDSRFPIDLLYVNADQTAATAAYLKSRELEGRYRIGFWHWEQPDFPSSFLHAFDHVDEVWVPSTFVQEAVAAVSPVPVYKIPHAIACRVSEDLEPQALRQRFGLPIDQRLALVMYDFHSYSYRKNPKAAIQAFRRAATGRNDVALVIKTMGGELHPQALSELRGAIAGMRQVVLIDEVYTRQQVWNLQSCCDMMISLHRAEGFGLALAEMMSMGKAVVATGWSSNTDFMSDANSMLVKYELKPLEKAMGAYPAGPVWAEADIEHAADCIIRLLDEPGLARRLGEQARQDITRSLSREAVGRLALRRLAALGQRYPELCVDAP
jgi:glycosyltransferase involved in cell wall biosynthesis